MRSLKLAPKHPRRRPRPAVLVNLLTHNVANDASHPALLPVEPHHQCVQRAHVANAKVLKVLELGQRPVQDHLAVRIHGEGPQRDDKVDQVLGVGQSVAVLGITQSPDADLERVDDVALRLAQRCEGFERDWERLEVVWPATAGVALFGDVGDICEERGDVKGFAEPEGLDLGFFDESE